jgi:hypothetical protein
MPAVVWPSDEQPWLESQVVENPFRKDLNSLEEALT